MELGSRPLGLLSAAQLSIQVINQSINHHSQSVKCNRLGFYTEGKQSAATERLGLGWVR